MLTILEERFAFRLTKLVMLGKLKHNLMVMFRGSGEVSRANPQGGASAIPDADHLGMVDSHKLTISSVQQLHAASREESDVRLGSLKLPKHLLGAVGLRSSIEVR